MVKKIILATLCLTILLAAAPVFAQQEQTAEEKEMMEKWKAFATPGEYHKWMAGKAGVWDAKVTSWMKPGAPPEVNKAVSTSEMILGGRYLHTKYSGTMMGMPFEGYSISCYDNHKKHFETLWIDNMGTGFLLTHGTLDDTKKILTETGVYDDFMTGKKMKFKSVSTDIDAKSSKFEMFMEMPDGKMFKNMEIIYTRKE
jgi:hypothetical protein